MSYVNFLVFIFLSACVFAEEPYAVSGNAYNIKTGKLIYRELFTQMDEAKNVKVNYVRQNGVIFARKILNYTAAAFQPSSDFYDERDKETLSVIFDTGNLILTHRINDASHSKILTDTSTLVIDAGVDALIQQEWGKLISGKKVSFELADARHLGTEKFIVKEIDVSESPLAYKGSLRSWKYFRVDTANKLASLFVESQFYAYDPQGIFLRRFQGRANIDDDSGEAFSTRIEYEYF